MLSGLSVSMKLKGVLLTIGSSCNILTDVYVTTRFFPKTIYAGYCVINRPKTSATVPSVNDRSKDGKFRPQLVILGTGWGSYSVLRHIDKQKYDVIVISLRNHFLFTPLLASTTVGTLEFR